MEPKKISFGFKKIKKAEKPHEIEEDKRDYIECLEEKSIKVVGGETVEEKIDLIIPMKPNTIITAERLQQIANEVEQSLNNEDAPKPQTQTPSLNIENETLDQMAERELLGAATTQGISKVEMTVPVPSNNLVGEKESTLEDYENVPIADFGMAMLRGMGWTPGQEQSNYKHPSLRPKGLGLGADKVIKDKNNSKSSKDNNDEQELMIVKNGFVKLIHGKYSGLYGKVVSLDEDNGRVLVDLPMKKETVSVNECMMQAVTKTQFDEHSRILSTFQRIQLNPPAWTGSLTLEYGPSRTLVLEIWPYTCYAGHMGWRDCLDADKYEEYKKTLDQKKQHPTESKSEDNSRRDNSRSKYDKSKNGKSHDRDNRSPSNERDRSHKIQKSDSRKRYTSESESESEKRNRRRDKKEPRDRNRERDRYHNDESDVEKRDKKYSRDRNTEIYKKRDRYHSVDSESDVDKRDKKESRNRERDKIRDRYHSDDSISDVEQKRKAKVKSSDSESSGNYRKSKKSKRDIDKKRKGKKKKRDRDRSPNYRRRV